MLRFAFQQVEGAPVSINIARGYLVGTNDESISGEIRFSKGRLECMPSIKRAAALNLECEMKEMGRL
ncbi:MAG: hypothetical protein NTY97_04445, partial [Planctomycetota bacterium]|nr:hypothetical protein [Planctomycetota bacterium]